MDKFANSLLDREFFKAAKLAIGIWSTVAHQEFKREQKKIPHKSLIRMNLGLALNTCIKGLQYAENADEWMNSTEFQDDQCTVQSAWTLENIAKVAGNDIVEPVFNYMS